MGRKEKLKSYLKDGLNNNWFPNLKYESSEVFYVELPWKNKNKKMPYQYEKILIKWHEITEKARKYPGYSTAKNRFQAALKKSIYLTKLKTVAGKLRFRFSTQEEIKEKRKARRLKTVKEEACCSENDMEVSSPCDPLSVASAEYFSGAEECCEILADLKTCKHETNLINNGDLENQIFTTINHRENKMVYDEHVPQKLFEDELKSNSESLDEFPLDFYELKKFLEGDGELVDNCIESMLDEVTSDGSSDKVFENIPLQDVALQPLESGGVMNKVDEVKLPLVAESQVPKKTYWLCTQKLNIGAILMLLCEKQDIETETQEILEGTVYIPDGAFEPGVLYEMKENFELNEKYFCFYVPRSV